MPSLCGKGSGTAGLPLNRFSEGCRNLSDRYPCGTALLFMGTGVVLHLHAGYPIGAWLSLIPVLLLIPLLGLRRILSRALLPLTAVVAVLLFDSDDAFPAPERRTGCEMRVILREPSLCGGHPSWIRNAPGSVVAEAVQVRFSGEDFWRDAGKKRLFLSLRRKVLLQAGYGDLVRVKGYVEGLSSPDFPGQWDFRQYGTVRRIQCRMVVPEGTMEKRGRGLRRLCYDLRGLFMERFCRGMSSRTRETASALLFGVRQGTGTEMNDLFLRSGTLHVLSVSGLHIGLFFGVFLFFFRILPGRKKWFFLLIPVFCYAFSTGMRAPAERAFLMLGTFCILKALLLKTENLNVLFLTAAVMVLADPLSLCDTGFQYSFLCVGILFLTDRFVRIGNRCLLFQEKYRLQKKKNWPGRLVRGLLLSAGASGCAWIASMGISLCRQSVISVAAVPAYLLMSPLAWISFLLFTLGWILSFLPAVPAFLGTLAGYSIHGILRIAEHFSDTAFLQVPALPGWTVWILPLLTVLLLTSRKRAVFFASAVLLVLFPAELLTAGYFSSPEVVVIRPYGEKECCILFVTPGGGPSMGINMPTAGCASAAAACLKNRGCDTLEELFLTSSAKAFSGGTELFLDRIRVRSLRLNASSRNPSSRRKRLRENGLFPLKRPGLFTCRKEADELVLRNASPLWNRTEVRLGKRLVINGKTYPLPENGAAVLYRLSPQ